VIVRSSPARTVPPPRGDRPQQQQSQRNDRPAQPRDGRDRQRNERAPQEQRAADGKTDYAALTKELFGEESTSTAKQEQTEKKSKGFGLGRLFKR
jgi:hypothetical protein